jgi:hypothetical protein
LNLTEIAWRQSCEKSSLISSPQRAYLQAAWRRKTSEACCLIVTGLTGSVAKNQFVFPFTHLYGFFLDMRAVDTQL